MWFVMRCCYVKENQSHDMEVHLGGIDHPLAGQHRIAGTYTSSMTPAPPRVCMVRRGTKFDWFTTKGKGYALGGRGGAEGAGSPSVLPQSVFELGRSSLLLHQSRRHLSTRGHGKCSVVHIYIQCRVVWEEGEGEAAMQ